MQTIQEGSRGVFVEYLQLALSRTGYPVTIDGVFGPKVRAAVLRLQTAYGLSPDGVVGPATWQVLMPFLRGYAFYTVKSGDTLFEIAKNFYTTAEKIQLANPQISPDALRVGQQILVPYGFSLVPTNVSYSYALLRLLYEGLLVRYPFLRGGSAGTSVLGQNLYYFEIGNGTRQVFFNGAHHANEWITVPLILKFLEEYAEAYIADNEIGGFRAKALFSETSLFIIPMVNPDGVDLVNGALSPDSPAYGQAASYAANYPQIPFPSGWKANIAGVDPNLSYPAGWEEAREIKFGQGYTSPAPRDYVGPAPLSAPESRAVYSFTQAHDFLLTLSYHTQGKVIFWKYLDLMPEGAREIGEYFSSVSGYNLEDTPYASSFAGYKDWYILTYNRPGYTIEAGSGVNPLPLSQFPEIYRDNLGILTGALAVFINTP